jgi:hypothetical protein
MGAKKASPQNIVLTEPSITPHMVNIFVGFQKDQFLAYFRPSLRFSYGMDIAHTICHQFWAI